MQALKRGNELLRRGEFDQALLSLKESLALYGEIGSREGMATTLQTLGTACTQSGQLERGRQYLEESLALYRQVERKGARSGEATTLLMLGTTYRALAQREKAIVYLREGLELSRSLIDQDLARDMQTAIDAESRELERRAR
jgi:tetratricopeptide (TPR) repeat protein